LQLATVLQRVGDLPGAKRQALLALEETPRFRAAQRRLIEIVEAIGKNEKDPKEASPKETKP